MAVDSLKEAGDIHGLIRLLDSSDPDLQWKAADALGTFGEPASTPLIKILNYPKMHVRLGAIEALGDIRSKNAVEPLIEKLKNDPDNEVRWVAALSLGQIGDMRAVPALVEALKDPDRYVRYGAVMSLEALSWTPENEETLAHMLIAQQEWKTLHAMKSGAVGPLVRTFKDPNPTTRQKVIELLGGIRGPEAKEACKNALRDRDPAVRWTAMQACKQCGVPTRELPIILASRRKNTPSPLGAAILNLFFFGLGYNYIGKWWGFPVFMCYLTGMVFIQLATGMLFPYIFAYPFTAIAAVKTYYDVEQMPDM